MPSQGDFELAKAYGFDSMFPGATLEQQIKGAKFLDRLQHGDLEELKSTTSAEELKARLEETMFETSTGNDDKYAHPQSARSSYEHWFALLRRRLQDNN